MVNVGMKPESAYYESLHETPLIANTIARKKLYEMNKVISDTAEYGCYLYTQACVPLLKDFMAKVDTSVIGTKFNKGDNGVDNQALVAVNDAISSHQRHRHEVQQGRQRRGQPGAGGRERRHLLAPASSARSSTRATTAWTTRRWWP